MQVLASLRSALVLLTVLLSLGLACPAEAQLLAMNSPLKTPHSSLRGAPVSAERIIPMQAVFTLTEDEAWVLVTLDGTSLGTATAVYADGVPVTSFSIRSQTRLVALLPAVAGTHLAVRTAAGLAVAWVGELAE